MCEREKKKECAYVREKAGESEREKGEKSEREIVWEREADVRSIYLGMFDKLERD